MRKLCCNLSFNSNIAVNLFSKVNYLFKQIQNCGELTICESPYKIIVLIKNLVAEQIEYSSNNTKYNP